MMSVLVLGTLLWAVVAVVLARLVSGLGHGSSRERKGVLILLGACVLILLIASPPHEDFFGGQDQGAYLNAAARYARENRFAFQDPLLASVPEATRSDFLYRGHKNPRMPTKLGVFDAGTPPDGRLKTYFQPAYPAMLAVVARAAPVSAVLRVTPVFAMLAGLALWVLARGLFRTAGPAFLASAFLILNPLTLWHARCVRPEYAATFFIVAGLALLMRAWTAQRTPWLDIGLAGLCFALAPFLHVTAWLVSLTVACLVPLLALPRRRALLYFPAFLPLALTLLVRQSFQVTDCYRFRPLLRPLTFRPVLTGLLCSLGWIAIPLICLGIHALVKRVRTWRASVPLLHGRWARIGGALLAVASAGLVLAALLNPTVDWPGQASTEAGGLAWRLRHVARQINITDMQAIVKAFTPWLAIPALAGWCLLVGRTGYRWPRRVAVALSLLPGILFVGPMPIFMYFLRRAIPFVLPGMALGLAALLDALPSASAGWRRRLRPGVAGLVMVLTLAPGRAGWLWQQTDYQGYLPFMERVAERIRAEDGLLLFEYSRMAAPFDHVFGIPTLGLDNEHITDYRRAEAAWEAIMLAHPERTAFFATPFPEQPASDRFTFEPVKTFRYRGTRLVEARGGMPDRVAPWSTELALYRMALAAGPETRAAVGVHPFVWNVGCSQMGIRHAERRLFHYAVARGRRMGPDAPWPMPLSKPVEEAPAHDLVILGCRGAAAEGKPSLLVEAAGSVLAMQAFAIRDHGWLFRVRLPSAGIDQGVSVRSDQSILITDACLVAADRVSVIELDKADDRVGQELEAPFLGAHGALGRYWLPGRRSDALVLASVYTEEACDSVWLCLDSETAIRSAGPPLIAGRWTWVFWSLDRGLWDNGNGAWVHFTSGPCPRAEATDTAAPLFVRSVVSMAQPAAEMR